MPPALLCLDSIAAAPGVGEGAVVVSGSHGGLSAARYAIEARVRIAVFNDAGVGRDGAGIAGLALLEDAGIAACTVSHDSARIGEAASTLDHGVISHVNPRAAVLGAVPGMMLRAWIATLTR